MLQGNVFQISQQASESLAKKYGTPLLVLSLEEVKRNYNICLLYTSPSPRD